MLFRSKGRGNDWGDPAVFDLDRDGTGDRPYRVGDPFQTLAASRPALEVYSGTLAARALAWAEEAFPVFAVPRVIDSAPIAFRHQRAQTPSVGPLAGTATRRLPLALVVILLLVLLGGWVSRRRSLLARSRRP